MYVCSILYGDGLPARPCQEKSRQPESMASHSTRLHRALFFSGETPLSTLGFSTHGIEKHANRQKCRNSHPVSFFLQRKAGRVLFLRLDCQKISAPTSPQSICTSDLLSLTSFRVSTLQARQFPTNPNREIPGTRNPSTTYLNEATEDILRTQQQPRRTGKKGLKQPRRRRRDVDDDARGKRRAATERERERERERHKPWALPLSTLASILGAVKMKFIGRFFPSQNEVRFGPPFFPALTCIKSESGLATSL